MCRENRKFLAVHRVVVVQVTRGMASCVERCGEQKSLHQNRLCCPALPFVQEYAILEPYRRDSHSHQEQQRKEADGCQVRLPRLRSSIPMPTRTRHFATI